ncbi:Insulin-like growth factor-binding protein 3 [Acipenser ruthenus]|uniref:Insulin-like growth factor-binding protein 3 n=1 Tax=Acipenser ruthenus TaxID=7906 RepID=A0A662YN70_ACIRT|nr:Insulin-like growth factor-binding protein 3 [Acipenser ruthenus]
MVSRLCVFCLAAVLALLSRLAEAVGPVVRCEPCDALALEQCKPLPTECAEKVREPGCGCCLTCALTEGNASDSEERNTSSTDLQGIPSTHRLTESKILAHPTKIDLIRKDLSKKNQRWKVEHPSEPIIHMDTHNFSSESKQETEYGPCRIEMESILNNLKILNILSPRGVRIPNCDKKGFYKKKQCRPSKGRKRGYCWCVDKYGHTLPGYDGKAKGESHCYNMEKK